VLFGKLYAQSHLPSDRWYKLSRELLDGRLRRAAPGTQPTLPRAAPNGSQV